jgi:hypothetical protein
MKKILIIAIICLSASIASAKEKCSDLPGFKKVGKDSVEYIKCLKGQTKIKLNTESRLTNWITGKEKFKVPNPINGLKKIGKALKPSTPK